jgi:hypothetical protein
MVEVLIGLVIGAIIVWLLFLVFSLFVIFFRPLIFIDKKLVALRR